MDIVEVPPKKSHDVRRLIRAAALLLSGAAVHLWLFPLASGPANPGMMAKLAASIAAVAREGTVGTAGKPEAAVVTSALGTVAPSRGTDSVPARRGSGAGVRVIIQTVHPAVIPSAPTIAPERTRMASALLTAPAQADSLADSSVSELDTAAETLTDTQTGIQPARLELPPVATSAASPEFDLAKRAILPRPQPVAAVPPPPARSIEPAHDLSTRVERPPDERLVSYVLQQYRRAYESLDVSAAQDVWPTVDARALGAAFRQLSSQRVTFESCGVSVSGSGAQATARCTGRAEFMPKVGGRRSYTASGEWVFDLQKENADWRIINANANIK